LEKYFSNLQDLCLDEKENRKKPITESSVVKANNSLIKITDLENMKLFA
jgi:hypothetical protein